jgi:hypothetical protein
VASMSVLHGCGLGSGEGLDSHGGISTQIESISSSEFRRGIQDFEEGYLAAMAFSELDSQPSAGTGLFEGQMAFDYSGDDRGSASSTLTLGINFGSGEVTGRAAQFAFASAEGTVTAMSGSLAVSGLAQDGRLMADVEGSLDGPPSGPYRQLSGNGQLQGSFRGLRDRPVNVAGTLGGTFEGSTSLEITAGAFFAVALAP